MPASRRHPGPRRLATVASAFAAVQCAALVLAARVAAAPTPPPLPHPSSSTGTPCDLNGPAGSAMCGKGTVPSLPDSNPLDPLSSLAKGCAEAASWTIGKLSHAVTATSQVDFTNASFLRQYAVVFAASTILTLVLWLLAVAKRAVRGVPLTEALSEAVGFLWLTVLASAFTPLVLYTLVSAVDAVTSVIATGTTTHSDVFFGSFAAALKKGNDIGGGPIMLIVVSLVSVLAAGVLWLELVIRAALLYVGALLGTAVYSGLVDKNMWHHVRRWAGIMIAVILVKPVVVVVLSLAGALSGSGGPSSFSAVVSGLAIILLAIFASAMIYRFVPGFGDDVVNVRNNRKASAESPAAAVISSPAALVKQGIKTHSSRGGQEQSAAGNAPQPAGAVSGGLAAHSSRTGNPGKATPPAAPAAPAPRTSERKNGGGTP
ncbi:MULTISPECIES: hypothetical protein [Streptomycetaceae]|uniref:Putative integral membrane protein n=1 Tax=Streptantibioticus cattleyicolor (strain ATCC 35852 / DSM 46488 / JCM 4925 / NBRC 14057 / NRRL 8057) TaxID=1003195 RepID=F8K262_STREN|nr:MULTISPECIES: hypothetical protein [Streptomycetaceae]AEW94950.1 putative integral membrane protein [Streptantibioticus cattleyicolor NRRL 8057 = DSM 46488]MYS59553.1 hypothetical protein [Streptomyces sp. SID5468]CCB75298.1 putative integral membrane protein [Streptantibioticus cattleyicolor NRRL 8057 = DSM 46488]